jgi:two-component system, sensor histidine kinase PdtaS
MSELPDIVPQELRDVALGMAVTADISRSDLLLLRPLPAGQVKIVAQAQPHSISPLHADSLIDRNWINRDAPVILDAVKKRKRMQAHRDLPGGAPVMQDVRPIFGHDGRLIGLLSFETSLIQLERHRQRHPSFRRTVKWIKTMCVRGELAGAAGLSPFLEMDGVMLVDPQRRITYLSGIANNLFRRLGYMEDLRGRWLSYLGTNDDDLAITAIQSRQPLECENNESGHIWVRKLLPVWAPPTMDGWLDRMVSGQGRRNPVGGVLVLIHDATEERRKKEELQVKTTMIQEVHHRVKNNLQTIAALLRMQARRSGDSGTQQALHEAIARILSVAVIHEFLSLDESQTINIKDVCQRIVGQARQIIAPGTHVDFTIEGPSIYLPSQQATACALVINELIQNALEHGYAGGKHGQVQIELTDGGDRVQLEICDDGTPLPDNFDLSSSTSLGLQIVRSLVQGDLHGEVRLENHAQRGVVATVAFPKAFLGKTTGA